MVRLLVIADDFTGALDTGIQFKTRNSVVMLYMQDKDKLEKILEKDIQVLIIDAETRHLSSYQAYQIVYQIVEISVRHGVSYIYKKTDSGLRGNIGSELTALLDATKGSCIHFFPAFPQMGRTTVNGVHYIDGMPVAKSVFGEDLFEPVRKSSVKEIIEEQSSAKVCLAGKDAYLSEFRGILIHDSETVEDMYHQAVQLKEQGCLHFTAGCAGFASILFGFTGIQIAEESIPDFNRNFLVICGSISSVTAEQLDYAADSGMQRVILTPVQKMKLGWLESQDGTDLIQNWKQKMEQCHSLIIECGVHDIERTSAYMKREGIELKEARKRISDAMGIILKKLLDSGTEGTILVTGGDTLLAFMKQIGQGTLIPVRELMQGVILSRLEYGGKKFNLISKSGGFGHKDLLIRLSDMITPSIK